MMLKNDNTLLLVFSTANAIGKIKAQDINITIIETINMTREIFIK